MVEDELADGVAAVEFVAEQDRRQEAKLLA